MYFYIINFCIFRILTDHISGRRIVDIDYIFKQIQNNSHGGGLDCSFINMDFVSDIRYGFFPNSNLNVKCVTL